MSKCKQDILSNKLCNQKLWKVVDDKKKVLKLWMKMQKKINGWGVKGRKIWVGDKKKEREKVNERKKELKGEKSAEYVLLGHL